VKIAGKFIVIEGGDGSGKSTQADKLAERFEKEGKHVVRAKFPRYGEPSAIYVERYLNGEYGSADEVPGDLASLAYAIDRFAASQQIRETLADPNVVLLADRYVASNLAHQGTKYGSSERRRAYYEQNMQLEYDILGIPRPDLNIVLVVPTSLAQSNMAHETRAARSYTRKTHDIHEADASHLERAKSNYEELCKLYPNEFTGVECMESATSMRSIEDIHKDILIRVNKLMKEDGHS